MPALINPDAVTQVFTRDDMDGKDNMDAVDVGLAEERITNADEMCEEEEEEYLTIGIILAPLSLKMTVIDGDTGAALELP
ncbi:hypothetical protein Mp_7g19090 [Marchantia polymorpha subsp. ruderalis]|uniref:Uncharacterized protein n=2 Tax=Marchantia polymorpha TaxID=3197 RepID=A0AAF6C1B1_MARPO|nr:hypothetical protein MARPO_0067s0069 [Marchantia polymorpha]BBN18045.1 hypothetical protein Mp_7g19090 [Marchantia polymorpha subsp. ruderalis]|eukprot:PTQ35990.1 hypothetical protein MARPO_0067s0069 [Marchantia polymorpha]